MERRETFPYTIDGNVTWSSHYREQYGGSLKKLKIELPYDPEIPLPGIYLEKNVIQKEICPPVFIVSVFTVAKTWKQTKCASTKEWIKMWYVCTHTHTHTHTHTGILLSHQKEWNNAICSNMDRLRECHTENQAEKEKCHTTSLICGI